MAVSSSMGSSMRPLCRVVLTPRCRNRVRRFRHQGKEAVEDCGGQPMKYLIMVQSNPTSLAHWETLTDQEREEFGRAHFALTDALLDSGQLVTSAGLAP